MNNERSLGDQKLESECMLYRNKHIIIVSLKKNFSNLIQIHIHLLLSKYKIKQIWIRNCTFRYYSRHLLSQFLKNVQMGEITYCDFIKSVYLFTSVTQDSEQEKIKERQTNDRSYPLYIKCPFRNLRGAALYIRDKTNTSRILRPNNNNVDVGTLW